jgi:hypothetical protein
MTFSEDGREGVKSIFIKNQQQMETKFTRGIRFLNDLINQTETGSKEYKLLCAAKHKYIQDF